MVRRRILLLLWAGVVIATVAANDRNLFDEAERRFSAGTYQLAIDRYRQLLDEFPASRFAPQAQLRVGQSLYYLGQYADSLALLQRAAVRAQGGAYARDLQLWIGLNHFQLAGYENADDALTSYLEGAPRDGRAALYRGLARLELERDAAAAADLELAVRRAEGSERDYAVAALMSLYARTGQSGATLALWRDLGSVDSVAPAYREVVLRSAADAADAEGDVELARRLYDELSESSIASAQYAYQRLYAIAQDAEDRDRMEQVFRAAERRLSGEPERLAEFWYALGEEAFSRERYELAELYLSRLWEVRDDRTVPGAAALLLARSVERQGRPDEALSILTESLADGGVANDAVRERRLDAIRLLLAAGELDTALAQTDRLAGRDRDAASLYAWALARHRAGRDAEALAELSSDAAQPLVRELAELQRLRARLALEAGTPEQAVRDYRAYLTIEPDDEATRLEFVRALVLARQFAAAAQEADRIEAAELSPERREERSYLVGLAAFHGGAWDLAVEALAAVESERFEPLRSFHLAWSHYRLGEIEPARREMGSVVDRLPPDLAITGGYLHAWTLYQSGRSPDAAARLLRLLGLGPTREQEIDIRRLLATVYLEQRSFDEALAQYRVLIERAGDDATRSVIWSQYASVLAAIGEADLAVEQYDTLNRLHGDTAPGRTALLDAGQLLFTESRLVEARERFRDYRNRYPDGAEVDRALYWAGRTSLELDEPGRALLWWEPLINEFPRSTYTAQALFETAEIYAARGERRRAIELYDRFTAAYRDNPRADEAERRRRTLRLELDGLSQREADLWVRLEPSGGEAPQPGGSEWFSLVLELARITIREQVTLTSQRTRIVDYLIRAADYERSEAAEASILLAEFYRRRGETRRALERYIDAAATPGASDELRAQSLYELALLARELGDGATMAAAIEELSSRYGDTVWADRAGRLMEGER